MISNTLKQVKGLIKFNAKFPEPKALVGQYCVLEPIKENHLKTLFESIKHPQLWEWVGPEAPKTIEELRHEVFQAHKSYFIYAIKRIGDERVVGCSAFMSINPSQKSIQTGYFRYAPDIQRTTMTTEVFYLMAKYAFEELNFNRLLWKCNKFNEKSKRAAERFGFYYEGMLRQDLIEKGVFRDTLYYSIISEQWGSLKEEYEKWLRKENFNQQGKEQKKLALRELRGRLNGQPGPKL